MSKMNGGTKIASGFLEKLEADSKSDLSIITPEKKKALAEIMYEYTPEVRKFVGRLNQAELADELLKQILTMRVVEFKITELRKCIEQADHYINTGSLNTATRDATKKMIEEAEQWLQTLV